MYAMLIQPANFAALSFSGPDQDILFNIYNLKRIKRDSPPDITFAPKLNPGSQNIYSFGNSRRLKIIELFKSNYNHYYSPN